MKRLFIAFELPENVKSQLAEYAQTLKKNVHGRFVGKELYHITLAFLGEAPEAHIDEITEISEDACERLKSIRTSLAQTGVFCLKRSTLLYAGVENADAVIHAAKRVRSALAQNNISYDKRSVKPHITIARNIDLNGGLTQPQFDGSPFELDTVVLYESSRKDGKLRYIPLHTIALHSPKKDVVAALIRRGEKILIARRSEEDGGLWEFPGGKIEADESAEQALRRELKEELGVESKIGQKLFETEHQYPNAAVRLRIYAADAFGEVRANVHSELIWAAPQELEKYRFLAADRPFIKTLIKGCAQPGAPRI